MTQESRQPESKDAEAMISRLTPHVPKELIDFLKSMPQDVWDEADAKSRGKQVEKRMPPFAKQLLALALKIEPLGVGASFDEDHAAYRKILSHAENIWHDACTLLKAGRYPTSVFLSIVSIEEIGKLSVARMQLTASDSRRKASARLKAASAEGVKKKKKGALYSHTQKHLMAACAGALINSRLDRIIGIEKVKRFLDDVERCDVERIRQETLYYVLGENGQHLPYERVTRDDACFYAVLAGELLAEVGGFEPGEFERLLAKVKELEDYCGLKSE
jgi:AbiV family abortive infection protein